jgi:hypothetical protein
MLPVGAYVCGIKNVKIDGTEPDQTLVLRLDIIEGEWAGYYTKRYEHESKNAGFNQQYEAKYKGDFRIRIPNPANTKSQHPEWDIKGFNNMVWCVESSNVGYKWNWDEMSLKGKIVGINVRRGFYNGNEYTQIGRLEVVDDVRKGIVRPMKDKKPSGENATATDIATGFTMVETDELPF